MYLNFTSISIGTEEIIQTSDEPTEQMENQTPHSYSDHYYNKSILLHGISNQSSPPPKPIRDLSMFPILHNRDPKVGDHLSFMALDLNGRIPELMRKVSPGQIDIIIHSIVFSIW